MRGRGEGEGGMGNDSTVVGHKALGSNFNSTNKYHCLSQQARLQRSEGIQSSVHMHSYWEAAGKENYTLFTSTERFCF